MQVKLIFTLLYCCAALQLSAQNFAHPLPDAKRISAGYGEIRPNHFHSGIDFSTGGRSLPVYSIAEGYVSRIKISPTGYGKALYITHPGGWLSVYAHLDRFEPEIEQYVRDIQSANREYSLDVIPDSLRLPIARGARIAYSGNTGGSSGPHLHFEIRDHSFENTFNPLLFGFHDADQSPPQISRVSLFPYKNLGRINNLNTLTSLPLVKNRKTKRLELPRKQKMPIVSGWVGFGFEGGDMIGKASSLTGIYDIRLEVDSTRVYHARFDAFSFSETRCVNGYMHYPSRVKSGRKIQQCVVPAHQMIGIYKSHQNLGYYYFDADRIYTVRYVLEDQAGNRSEFALKVRGKRPDFIIAPESEADIRVLPGTDSQWTLDDWAEVQFASESLFDTTALKFRKSSLGNNLGYGLELGSMYIPINQKIKVRLKPRTLPDSLYAKLVVVRMTGNSRKYLNTSYTEGFAEAFSEEFGDFWLEIDTLPPSIRFERPPAGYKVVKKGRRRIKKPLPPSKEPPQAKGIARFTIADRHTGIPAIQAYLSNEWILLEPGTQDQVWEFRFPEDLDWGCHIVEIKATDANGNTRIWTGEFERTPPEALQEQKP